MYGSWDIRHDKIFLPFWAFDPPNKLKKQNFEKMKKTPGDIILLHLCTKNDNHQIMYGSWEMEHDRQIFFVILDYFLTFYPINNPENQDFEKWTKCLEISLYTSAPEIMITCYTVP